MFLVNVFLWSSFFGAFVSPVHADENFRLDLTTEYTVLNDGTTRVEQKFSLTNKKPTVFAKQYALEFGATELQNVRVFDEKGDIPTQVTPTEHKTSVGITFNEPVVGEGKTRKFTIAFESHDLALVNGKVLEVYIPKLTNTHEYNNYKVVLKTPLSFGNPVRVLPGSYTLAQDGQYMALTFEKLNGEGITALFGEKQIFDFSLKYHLMNPTGDVGVAQIALPPDTPRQKVVYTSLEPKPDEVKLDLDGNWIATYQIQAQKNVEVVAQGSIATFLENHGDFLHFAPQKSHLQADTFWEVSNSQVKELSKQYKTPKEIYDYVVTNLEYNYKKAEGEVERLGAVDALASPKEAVCQEFTDVFVGMARAAGIPARRATGYAHTQNARLRPLSLVQDVLHTWPEYYDQGKSTWIPVDPTWANTTGGANYFDQFDFNHLVFAYNGISSTLPHPAGAYKPATQNTKDVDVQFGKELPSPEQSFTFAVQRKPFLISPFKNDFTLFITNNTGTAFYQLPLSLTAYTSSDQTTTITQVPTEIDYLLPFQTREFSFSLPQQSAFTPASLRLTASINTLSSSHELKTGLNAKEVFFSKTVAPITVGGSLVIFAILAGGLLVLRRVRQRTVRRQSKKS